MIRRLIYTSVELIAFLFAKPSGQQPVLSILAGITLLEPEAGGVGSKLENTFILALITLWMRGDDICCKDRNSVLIGAYVSSICA